MLRIEERNTFYDVRNRLRHAPVLTTEREYDHFETIWLRRVSALANSWTRPHPNVG